MTIIGDIANIIGQEIILAEEDRECPDFAKNRKYEESHSWTNFYLKTEKGRLEIYFLVESNGYYSESISMEVIKLKY